MSKETVRNDILVVALSNFFEKCKAMEVAAQVKAVMQNEILHTHEGITFFTHKDSNGALVLTMESMVWEQVKAILLSHHIADDELQECLEQMQKVFRLKGNTMTTQIVAIPVEGSDSSMYLDLLKHTPTNDAEEGFLKNLEEAVEVGVKSFNVMISDPLIDENGSLQFVPGCKSAEGYSYNEWEELANKNGVQLGSKNQYVLFLATIIHWLMVEEDWSMKDAFHTVCIDSTELGDYCRSVNTYKILAKDEETGGFWLAGDICNYKGVDFCPPACLDFCNFYGSLYFQSVGWFVF